MAVISCHRHFYFTVYILLFLPNTLEQFFQDVGMNFIKVFLRFWSLLAVTSLVLMSQSLQAGEPPADDLQPINTDNLPQFVSQISDDYYQQLESLLNFYQLYQQKRDPRGFNVWHLRGFSPVFSERQQYYQVLQDSAASEETQPTVTSLVAGFNHLGTIATKLMVAFRDSNPDAYQQAKALISENNALFSQQLKQFQLDSEIRDIRLN